ncbi:MAG: hypothetical protein K9G31_10715 [Crocinitomicaceae bacterium]|nr:hypothetical protein [Crocinitomicaceae bacterium]MCF8445078.1 hypothetical protein [Crocinitomicaceae bacterium]
MKNGIEINTWENACQRTKQKFGKPHHTGRPFACQTLAFYPTHHIFGFDINNTENKFLPP